MANNLLPQNHSAHHDPNPQGLNPNDMDRQLDRALQSYLPPPRAGLEQRILARAQSVAPRRAWLQPRFAFLAAAVLAACTLAAILFAVPGRVPTPQTPDTVVSQAPASQPSKSAPAPFTHNSMAEISKRSMRKPAPIHKPPRRIHTPSESNLPQLAVFPAPAPPTPQEEELAIFAARYPKLAKEAFKPITMPKTKPIVIHPIQIKPITIAPLSIAKLDSTQRPVPHQPENLP